MIECPMCGWSTDLVDDAAAADEWRQHVQWVHVGPRDFGQFTERDEEIGAYVNLAMVGAINGEMFTTLLQEWIDKRIPPIPKVWEGIHLFLVGIAVGGSLGYFLSRQSVALFSIWLWVTTISVVGTHLWIRRKRKTYEPRFRTHVEELTVTSEGENGDTDG